MTGHSQVIIESILGHVVNCFRKNPARVFDEILRSTFKSFGLKFIPFLIRNVAKANRLGYLPEAFVQRDPDIAFIEMRVWER